MSRQLEADEITSQDQAMLAADFGRTHGLLAEGVTPFFEWLAWMRDQQPETRVRGSQHAASNGVALYLSGVLKQEMMVLAREPQEKGATRYVIEYMRDSYRQIVPLPLPFALILDRLDLFLLHFSSQPDALAKGCRIEEVAGWLDARQDMQDLRILSTEGYYGVRIRQCPGLVRHIWFVEFTDFEGTWSLYTKPRRHRREVDHAYKQVIWALKFARAEVLKRRP